MSSTALPAAPPDRLAILTAAVHRPMFLAGAVQLLASVLFWLGELWLRRSGQTLATVLPATWAHVLLMLYGSFTFFIFGFLLTVYPRWMDGPELVRAQFLPTVGWLAGGQALVWIGLFGSKTVLGLGLAAMLVGWGLGAARLYGVYFDTGRGKLQERVLNGALAGGWLGLAGFLFWLLSGDAVFLMFALKAGLWFWLLPVFVTVCHRMIPFFGSCVLPGYAIVRPDALLKLWAGGAALHGLLELANLPAWTWIIDLPMAASAAWIAWQWQPARALKIRLLGVLHIAFWWFGFAMFLYGLNALLLAFGGNGLGRAPLHAIGIGLCAALVIAMATRVTLGHSGGRLMADDYTWYCFLAINAAALARVAADVHGWPTLNLVAAALWIAAFGAWVWKYAPIYLKPRSDGRPG